MKSRPQANITFKAYEDSGNLIGTAKAKLPSITHKLISMTGAGVMGTVDVALAGMIEAMSLGLDFLSATDASVKLMEPREHTLTLRSAAQVWNETKGRQETQKIKYVLVIAPKGTNPGSLTPMSESNASGEYSVYYYAAYQDGEELWEIDPINQVFRVQGEDYYAEIRQALGE